MLLFLPCVFSGQSLTAFISLLPLHRSPHGELGLINHVWRTQHPKWYKMQLLPYSRYSTALYPSLWMRAVEPMELEVGGVSFIVFSVRKTDTKLSMMLSFPMPAFRAQLKWTAAGGAAVIKGGELLVGTFRELAVVAMGMLWHWAGKPVLSSVTSPPCASLSLSGRGAMTQVASGGILRSVVWKHRAWLLLLLSLLLQMFLLNPPGSSGRMLLTP